MRLARLNPGMVVLDATMTLSKAIHDGKVLILSVLTGHTITLPPAAASGARFRFYEKTAPTSGSTIVKVANAVDIMQGSMAIAVTAGGAAFPTAATSDTITENRTTTGGATAGGFFELEDVAVGVWSVRGVLNGSGAAATPFSATVN